MAKTERLQLRMTPELKAKLQMLADAENRSMANMIEVLINRAAEKQEKEG